MTTVGTTAQAEFTDAELVAQSLAGSHEAFGRIVRQYQGLVCAIAYSATGNVSRSEDLAQETFVTAWRKLNQLREPQKLRSWLCSIARSVASNALRSDKREPTQAAAPLDAASGRPTATPDPTGHAINHEEEAILWRSLERIPELYREPMVLFYREEQSVERVAEKLELSEEAVRMRLSRGRKLLAEEVAAFVEGALARSGPGKAFTIGVLAALPVCWSTSKAATIGATASKSGAAVKAVTMLGWFGPFAGAAVGIIGGILGMKLSIESAQSERERSFIIKQSRITWVTIIIFNVVLFGGGFVSGPYWKNHALLLSCLLMGLVFGFGMMMMTQILWFQRQMRKIRMEEAHNAAQGANPRPAWAMAPYQYRSRWTLLGLPLVDIKWNSNEPAKGWIACGNTAYGILFASGGIAVGLISMGGIAVGVLTLGGAGFGVISFGGLAVGVWALGGGALGDVAMGGAAIGWQAADGGVAMAHQVAVGGMAFAAHANDDTARNFIRDNLFFKYAYVVYALGMLGSITPAIFTLLRLRKVWRRRER